MKSYRQISRRIPACRNLTRNESGQAIVETTLTMIIICLLLLGLLQVFQIAVADMITSYSAFTAGRSYAVGFSAEGGGSRWWRNLVYKSARVSAIGASGKRIFPDDDLGNETAMIKRYLSDSNQWLEYEYWWGENEYDYMFYRSDVEPPATHLYMNPNEETFYTVDMEVQFTRYPFPMFDLIDPDRTWFDSVEDSRNINAHAELMNHAEDYMQE